MADGAITGGIHTPKRNKQRVAQSFSQAAERYDSLANLQRQLGDELFTLAQKCSGAVLDVGCGTGYFSEKLASITAVDRVIGLDFAAGMLDFARAHRHRNNIHWVQGDAEAMPIETDSIDMIFANLSLQWSEQPDALFAELTRVLKPGGRLIFNTLGPNTLCELRDAWAAVDPFVHVNDFSSVADLVKSIPSAMVIDKLKIYPHQLQYDHGRRLLQELKGIGASNQNLGRPSGLGGRKRLSALSEAYERYRLNNGKLPATYEVIQGIYRKIGAL